MQSTDCSGIKSKVLAAHRLGLSRVILPNRNRFDLADVPEEVRASMEFILVDDMSQVWDAVLVSEEGADKDAVAA